MLGAPREKTLPILFVNNNHCMCYKGMIEQKEK